MNKAIKPIKIGENRLENNLFLAPMLGFTNVAFREVLQKTASISTFTEMVPVNSLSKDSNYCKDLIKKGKAEKNVFYQLFGNDEEKFKKAVDNLLDSGIKPDFININLGCPRLNIIKQGAGCALLKREPQIHKIVKELHNSFEMPITIKIRSGYNIPKHLNYSKLEEEGCDAIFLHARTRKQGYSGKIDLNYIKEAKEKTKIPIIANGDIKSMDDCEFIHNRTNSDGFMIGRFALQDPFVFREILSGKKSTYKEKIKFLEDYYKALEKYKITNAFEKIKIFCSGVTKGMPNATKNRSLLVKTKNIEEIMGILKY